MTTTKTTKIQPEDDDLQKVADCLDKDLALYGAALDGLIKRSDGYVAELDAYGVDDKMRVADDEVADLAADVVKKDAHDLEALNVDIGGDDAEEDKLLVDDELPPKETVSRMTSEEVGLPE